MYLLILEDGDIIAVKNITDNDKTVCNDGYVDIIDINDSQNPKYFLFNEWKEIEKKKN